MSITESVVDALDRLKHGPACTHKNLTLIPLIAPADGKADYRTLDEALAAGWIRVTEVSDGGSVPELKVVNSGDWPVLLLDGEELLGAKQNRVVNLSILVPRQREIVIPVSCVESGRWRDVSNAFGSSPRTQFAEGRAAKMEQVSCSMTTRGSRASSQSAVWSQIAEKSQRLDASSATAAMSAMFERVGGSVEEFVAALPSMEKQVGAVFAIDGCVAGLEMFDAASTWRSLGPKLVRSYALDALDPVRRRRRSASIENAAALIARLRRASAAVVPAIGEGEDVRLSESEVVGAALFARDHIVHLSVFPRA